MTITDYISGSCVGGQIGSLSSHTDGEDAMEAFCSKVLGKGGNATMSRFVNRGQGYNLPGAFYTFTCGPESEKGSISTSWKAYATEFATFIVKNKLGRVVTPGPRENRVNHPGQTCQTFLWAPDPDTLIQWWKDRQVAKAERERVLAEERAAKRKASMEQYGGLASGVIGHCGAQTSDKEGRYSGAIGGSFIVERLQDGYAYLTGFNGNQQYVTVPSKSADDYIELIVGAKYVVIDANTATTWTIVQVPREGYELKEVETITKKPAKCIKNRNRVHCFCGDRGKNVCCYCHISATDAAAMVDEKKINHIVVKVEPPVIEPEPEVEVDDTPDPIIPVAEELLF